MKHIDLWLMCFIFLLLLVLPVIFTRVDGAISWRNVFKIWQDRMLLIPVFVINHWLLVPRFILKKQYYLYVGLVSLMILGCTLFYYFHDEVRTPGRAERAEKREAPPGNKPLSSKPTPVPPYADLLLFSLLIVAVDTGLSLSKSWHQNEEDRIRLEKENARIQLAGLRNQVSPHFFMNTLNNIYALIDTDTQKSKQAMMKLSKLMRYLLYENQSGKVTLSKEFEFIRSYVDLMTLRFSDEITIHLELPEIFEEVEIPPMLFISYIENAFKHGTSYQHQSYIRIGIEVMPDRLIFTCINSINRSREIHGPGGLGMENSRKRLDLLYRERYTLDVHASEKIFTVELNIPLS
jgi:hypothetical protein